jgi:hypothetical protein
MSETNDNDMSAAAAGANGPGPGPGNHYSEECLSAAHKHTIHHRDEILRSTTCTCFYCGYQFDPRHETEPLAWTDTNPEKHPAPTLLCPMCGIDCVIGDASGYPVSDPEFVRAFTRRWFNGYSRIDDDLPPEKLTWTSVVVK